MTLLDASARPLLGLLAPLLLVFLFLVIVLAVYLVQNEVVRYRSRIKGLPGPRGWPVTGNLFQHPEDIPPEIYRKWSKRYGDVFQIQLGNTTAVIVNSADAAKQFFLGQRNALNSRPTFYVFHGKVSKAVTSIGTSPWDESCKRRRKVAATALNRVRVDSYAHVLNMEAREFLRDLYSECRDDAAGGDGAPGTEIEFLMPVKRFSLNLSLTLNYGTRVSSVKALQADPLLAEIIYVESEISKFRDTGKNFANYIPLLRWWEPVASLLGQLDRLGRAVSGGSGGAPKNHAADIGQRRLAYNNVLLDRLRDEVAAGVDKPCIQGSVLRDPESATLNRGELISVSLSMMAGADSNQPTITWAILTLAHRPDVQAKAYAAIKEAGLLNAPSNAYASSKVDYIEALTKEINRYYTVLRLALPKATYTEATWNGATIPPNTLVFLNSWACNRDPKFFADADVFAPERWLDTSADQHAHQFAFGMGGRMCVASHLAHRALYTVFLHLISRFHISPADGTTDVEIDPIKGLRGRAFVGAAKGSRARFTPREGTKLESWLDNPDQAM